MKSSLIAITILSLLSVGLVSNSYADVGDFISDFDGADNGNGGLIFPLGIAVDSDNRILVVDGLFQAVQIYESDGTFITSFNGGDTVGGTDFSQPYTVAVDSNNRIIVGDRNLKTVQIFESDGTFVTSIISGTPFSNPYAVAVDTNNRILVVDVILGTVQIFSPEGVFIDSIDGTAGDGSTPFVQPNALAVDNNNRIIVGDVALNTVQIFNPDGSFVTSFDGSDAPIAISDPNALAVDKNNNIIVSDTDFSIVQIFNSQGTFVTSIDGTAGDGSTPFILPFGVAVDNNNRILVADGLVGTVQIFEGFIVEEDIPVDPAEEGEGSQAAEAEGSGNGGCPDCTAPTLGLNSFYVRVVDDGFSYNGNSVQVEKWHTPFPLINATVGETNIVEIIVYENQGVNNLKLVQFGLGGMEIGQPLTQVEVLIEVWLDINSNNFAIEEIIINDEYNLIESSSVIAVIDVTKCTSNSQNETCLKVTLQYSYREPTLYHMMIVNLRDKPGNSQNFYLNEGIQVLGDSLNEPPTYIIQNRKTSQQTEDLTLTLTRTDKVNHIWEDKYGIEYLQVSKDRFDRLTAKSPIECTDPPLSEINVPTRLNCNFRELTQLWTDDNTKVY